MDARVLGVGHTAARAWTMGRHEMIMVYLRAGVVRMVLRVCERVRRTWSMMRCGESDERRREEILRPSKVRWRQ